MGLGVKELFRDLRFRVRGLGLGFEAQVLGVESLGFEGLGFRDLGFVGLGLGVSGSGLWACV